MAEDVPQNVSATTQSTSQIDVSWDDVDVDEYDVLRDTDSGSVAGDYSVVTTVTDDDSSSYTYNDTGLTEGETFYYRIDGIFNFPRTLDSFEAGNLNNWNARGSYAVLDNSSSSFVDTTFGTHFVHATADQNLTPSNGLEYTEFTHEYGYAYRFRWHHRANTSSRMFVLESGSDSGYYIEMTTDGGAPDTVFTLYRWDDDGSDDSQLDQTTVGTAYNGEWMEFRFEFQSDGTIDADVYDESGTSVTTLSGSDSFYDVGGGTISNCGGSASDEVHNFDLLEQIDPANV